MAAEISSFVLVAGLSALSGAVISIAVNIVAYGAHQRAQQSQDRAWYHREGLLTFAYFMVNNVGCGIFLYASSLGAVSVAMPAETAALLLSNLVLQSVFKIGKVHSTQWLGTILLCVATSCLGYAGPSDDGDASSSVFRKISEFWPLSWLLFNVALGVASLTYICIIWEGASKLPAPIKTPLLDLDHKSGNDQRVIPQNHFLSKTASFLLPGVGLLKPLPAKLDDSIGYVAIAASSSLSAPLLLKFASAMSDEPTASCARTEPDETSTSSAVPELDETAESRKGFWESRKPSRNLLKTCAYATFVAVVTALASSVGKMMTESGKAGMYPELYCSIAVYILLGIASVYFGAKAASECNQAQYLPINECVKLVINALTGLIVWRDDIQHPAWYAVVYALICIGAFLCA
mmetsp:Transcript_145637/g.256792  ORF Transcript_145637/g.256792 Transcript_145637/m.256792 type:complete len:406 (-) Transcript_145637:795-2012(-)